MSNTMVLWASVLEGKRALVLGGGGVGNGPAICRALAAAGAAVAVVDIDGERARAVVGDAGPHQRMLALQCDVSSGDDLNRAVSATLDAFGGLDILVTVVGGHTLFAPWARIGDTADEDWDRVYDLNLRYVFRAVRAAVSVFLSQGTGGSIVSIGSISGIVSSPFAVAYGAAKAGLINLARSVAAEYARDGIRMNVVSLGAITTETSKVVDSDALGFVERIPMGRLGRPEEVADAVVFLASPMSGYTSGQSLTLDGAITTRFPVRVPNSEPYIAG